MFWKYTIIAIALVVVATPDELADIKPENMEIAEIFEKLAEDQDSVNVAVVAEKVTLDDVADIMEKTRASGDRPSDMRLPVSNTKRDIVMRAKMRAETGRTRRGNAIIRKAAKSGNGRKGRGHAYLRGRARH